LSQFSSANRYHIVLVGNEEFIVLFLFAFVGYVIHWFGGIAVQFDPIDYARGVFIQIKHDSLTVFPFF